MRSWNSNSECKSTVLYAIMKENDEEKQVFDAMFCNLPPPQLTYWNGGRCTFCHKTYTPGSKQLAVPGFLEQALSMLLW